MVDKPLPPPGDAGVAALAVEAAAVVAAAAVLRAEEGDPDRLDAAEALPPVKMLREERGCKLLLFKSSVPAAVAEASPADASVAVVDTPDPAPVAPSPEFGAGVTVTP